ncbi:response regulator [Granulicella sp. 5B5]|uniref:response regulator n=1 Tax=Granulicella sp. 5B5 TaxID=1617967 RepID=UPI0021079A25|nr:response regulator [Granulicella sp. 5B5]
MLCATTSRPDAILLDFSMPGMDGPTPLRAAQCIPALASVPVLFLTARAYSGHVAGLGAAGVVAKPFDPRTLGRQIASVLCWS